MIPPVATVLVTWLPKGIDTLGPVDGFDQDQYAGETDNRVKAGRGFLAPHGDTLEAFQFACTVK